MKKSTTKNKKVKNRTRRCKLNYDQIWSEDKDQAKRESFGGAYA